MSAIPATILSTQCTALCAAINAAVSTAFIATDFSSLDPAYLRAIYAAIH